MQIFYCFIYSHCYVTTVVWKKKDPDNFSLIVQSNLDYPDYSIIRTFFSGPNFLWILISCDLENWKSQKAQ